MKCKACLKKVTRKSLMRHVGQKQICRSTYGEEFIANWKKETTNQSKKKYKENNKAATKIKNSQYYEANKEKFKEAYQKNKEIIKRRYHEEKERRFKELQQWRRDIPYEGMRKAEISKNWEAYHVAHQ